MGGRLQPAVGQLYVRSWHGAGDASSTPPVVLLHGAVIAGDYMAPLGRALGRALRVYAPDLPGCGRSNRVEMPSDVEEIARALNAWMTANDHVGAVVVGNSMGCQVAAELAIRHPGSACGLVLVGPTLDPFARSPLQLLARSARVALNEPIPLHAIWLRDLMRAGLRGATRALRSSVVHHIDERLEHVPIPTLIVRGEKDRLVSQRWAEAATRMLPAGELFVVMGAGHAAHYSRPSEVAEAIVSFLARHRLAPGLRQPI